MTTYDAKFMRYQVLNLAYCIINILLLKKVEIMEVCSFGNCVKITA